MQSFKHFITIQEGELNPVFADEDDVLEVDNWIENPRVYDKDKSEIADAVSDIYDRYSSYFKGVEKRLKKLIRKETKKNRPYRVFTDIKTIDSVLNKAVTRGRGIAEMNDIVRGAILFSTKNEADAFVKRALRRNRDIIVNYEEKKKGEDNEYGYYGSHHLDINIDGLVVELQIMTRKLWDYKKEAHKIYTQSRSRPDGPDDFDRSTSKHIFRSANEALEQFDEQELIDMGGWTEMDLDVGE